MCRDWEITSQQFSATNGEEKLLQERVSVKANENIMIDDRELNTSISKCFYSCYYKDKHQCSGKYNVLHPVLLSSYKKTMEETLDFLT